MSADLLDLLGGEYRRVAAKDGGEYAGPCPWCGGHDRFHVWPYGDHPRWWCRQCERRGDAITFLRQYEGLTFQEACERLGHHPAASRRAACTQSAKSSGVEPPAAAWQERARGFIESCRGHLWSDAGTRVRRYLHEQRGLTDETVRSWGLGYKPAEAWDNPGQWGLDSEETRVWLPRSIVIPTVVDGTVWSISMRRPELQGAKYVNVRGSRFALFGADQLPPAGDARTTVVLAEGYLDCLLLHEIAGDLVGVATMGSCSVRLSTQWLWRLRHARRIWVAYDLDSAGEAGSAALAALSARMRLVRPIGGHDLTDMHQAGGDLRAWVLYHLARLEAELPTDLGAAPLEQEVRVEPENSSSTDDCETGPTKLVQFACPDCYHVGCGCSRSQDGDRCVCPLDDGEEEGTL